MVGENKTLRHTTSEYNTYTLCNTCLLYTTHVYFMQHMYLYAPHAVQEKLFGPMS